MLPHINTESEEMAKSKKSRKKWYIIGGVSLIVIVLIGFNMARSDNGATVVQADLAYLDDISELVTASGRIEPQTKVDIVAEVSAEIQEVYVREGDQVLKGDPLILLDTIQAQSDVSQARFSLDEISARSRASETQFEKDKREFERQESLYEKGLTSETEFTNARLTYQNSQAIFNASVAQVNTARARLEKVQDNLSKTRILAPMSGIVTFLDAEVGEIAQAQTSFTQGRTLMTIADLDIFEVEVDVDETEIAKVKLNQETDIRVDAFPDTSFAGSVVEIGNSAKIQGQGTDNYTTSFRVKVRFTDTDAPIRPGMSATVDITAAHRDEALLIPYAAVVTREFDPDSLESSLEHTNARTGGSSADSIDVIAASANDNSTAPEPKKGEKVKLTGVFVIENGLAKFVEIKTGIADERNIVALSGLTPGDTIVSGSFQTLRKLGDGESVQIDERSKERMNEGYTD
jgi:HlyD family secretion protein